LADLSSLVEPPTMAELERAMVKATEAGEYRLARGIQARIEARVSDGALVLPFRKTS
jgi:hypothetical protein